MVRALPDSFAMNLVRSLSLALLGGAFLLAQNPGPPQANPKDDEENTKAGVKDPFTGGDAKLMQAAGVVAYGPFPWADDLTTASVDKVLGENRIRWVETQHFLIGCTFGSATMPDESEVRKLMNGEFQRMRKRFNKFPERASKIDPWLRLHLYAQRAEELYAEFAKLVGHDDASGTYLGQKKKFPILLFQKKSDLARYLDRFCGIKSDFGMRHFYAKTEQYGFVMAAEGDDPKDEATVHAQFRFFMVEAMLDAIGGVPYWVSIGLAHCYERQVPSNTMMAAIKDNESVDEETQNKWPLKMRKRAGHPELLTPLAGIATKTDFGYWDHLQSWSRIDWLVTTDRAKFGKFLGALKGKTAMPRQVEAIAETYGLDPDVFDTKWREWVLKAYK